MVDGIVTVAAPAKLNLYLHVTGRREDGYHSLDSLIAFANVGDQVKARAAADGSLTLTVRGPFAKDLANETDNLVMRAARGLRAVAGMNLGAHLVLDKRLPVASGIGGGSADAAATLKALVRLWGVTVPEKTILELALELGADVPVCWYGQAAFVGGVGEMIEPAPLLPPAALVLVNPLVPVSTPAVFKARTGAVQQAARFAENPIDAAHLAHLLAARGNGLTDAACGLAPQVRAVLDFLGRTDGALITRMSGSGGTCFALFADDDAALSAGQRLMEQENGWWVSVCRLGAMPDNLS